MASYLWNSKQWFCAMLKFKWLIFFIIFSSLAYAATDRYPFTSRADELRYEHLLLELRCAVCQNQSLAESNAPLAEDLRQEVYKQIVAGKSNPDIKTFLVERYGPTVLYEPPLQSNTLFLWLGPLLLLFIGGAIWIWRTKR